MDSRLRVTSATACGHVTNIERHVDHALEELEPGPFATQPDVLSNEGSSYTNSQLSLCNPRLGARMEFVGRQHRGLVKLRAA